MLGFTHESSHPLEGRKSMAFVFRYANIKDLIRAADPGPHYYTEYQFSRRVFRKRDVPGPTVQEHRDALEEDEEE
jgi:hypothetical protein